MHIKTYKLTELKLHPKDLRKMSNKSKYNTFRKYLQMQLQKISHKFNHNNLTIFSYSWTIAQHISKLQYNLCIYIYTYTYKFYKLPLWYISRTLYI
jgi:pyruvate kinase